MIGRDEDSGGEDVNSRAGRPDEQPEHTTGQAGESTCFERDVLVATPRRRLYYALSSM
ncbi:MAG: hypothetical protein ABEI98_03590 [Halorhabdus sp.]